MIFADDFADFVERGYMSVAHCCKPSRDVKSEDGFDETLTGAL